MEESLSKDQMLYESYLMMKGLTIRLDRHGVEHRDDMDKIWEELKLISKSISELSDNHGTRLTKLESEKNFFGKIVTSLIGIASGLFGAWLGRHQ